MADYEQALTDSQPKSTHKCEVVVVHPESHPNADKLEVVKVYGYSVCVGKGNFNHGDLGVYIPPDSIVPATETFRWVWEAKGYVPAPGGTDPVPEKYRRIKAKVLRGIISEGILVSLPSVGLDKKRWSPNGLDLVDKPEEGYVIKEGDDVAEVLGITHYNPPEPTTMDGDCEQAPTKIARKARRPKTLKGWCRFIWHRLFPKPKIVEYEENTDLYIPNYEVDAWQRYKSMFVKNEPVYVTEKIHGANCKFTFMNERMYVGSHYQWKKDIPGSAFWAALRQNAWIEKFCRDYPGSVLYGELVPTQKLKYGQKPGQYKVFGFDILYLNQVTGKRNWLSYNDVKQLGLLEPSYWVPIIAEMAYDETTIREYSEGNSLVAGANHIREGIVIRPLLERSHPHFGRVVFKIVSPQYLNSKHSEE